MTNVFFIADLHFGHKNMALYRGFNSVEEHDQYIIDCWNKVVGKRSTVWILGDVTMEKTSHYHLLDKLKGSKRVVLGNHDKPQHVKQLLNYVDAVAGMVDYKGYCLSHCPIHEIELSRYKKNIHGHVHGNSLNDRRYVNVSCEAVNYTPISFEQIESRTRFRL